MTRSTSMLDLTRTQPEARINYMDQITKSNTVATSAQEKAYSLIKGDIVETGAVDFINHISVMIINK